MRIWIGESSRYLLRGKTKHDLSHEARIIT